ncbi:MAG: hypothetical protein KAY24_00680 [Candidatus Eisenbacteria sp.]|nr:hypothetical protein [Candidatus Eisenbacteria bacterium]
MILQQRAAARAVTAAGLALFLMSDRPVQAQEMELPSEPEEFSFDVGEFDKSPWSLDGYVQGDLSYSRLNRDAASYRLDFIGKDRDRYRLQSGMDIHAGLTYQQGPLRAYGLGRLEGRYDGKEWGDDLLLYEGNLSLQAGSNAYFTLGKTLLRWGKGYAWNPTNFAGRNRNPSDPDLALEGYWMGFTDIVKSFSGPLKALSLMGVILPVFGDANSAFGEEDHINVAGKLYLLLYDTDIDFMALSEGSRSARYGLATSRNVTSSFEIHGELALITDSRKTVLAPAGTVTTETNDAWNCLAGIRYLAPTETTFILEFYRHGEGYSEDQAKDYFAFTERAEDAQLTAAGPTLSGYEQPNFMQNYFYLRVSQKEPFGWLYVTPSLLTICNLEDGSFNLIPEITYTGTENLELRLRFNYVGGAHGTEYGEKLNAWRTAIRMRYFF